MRKLLPYDKFSVLELNKTVGFFRENPHLLPTHSTGIPKKKNAEWDPSRVGTIDYSKEVKRKEEVLFRFRKKLEKIDNVNKPIGPGTNNPWTILDILSGYRPGHSEWYSWDQMKRDILESSDVEEFINKEKYWSFPGGSITEQEMSSYVDFCEVLRKNFKEIREQMRRVVIALENIKGSVVSGFEKDMMKRGVSAKDVEIVMSHITDWTSMSQKRLDPLVWPLLKKLSVDPSRLPKTIYRGLFIDGDKIKDREGFLKKWYPGSKPKVSLRKATSWSVDRGTASEFMDAQSNIKDRTRGFYVLLRWEVNPSMVIADLRNLPVDHKFWNQQEIIISPEVKDYVVDTIVPGERGYKAYSEFLSTIKGGQGGMGMSRSEFAGDFMNTPYETLSPEHRIEFKRITKMTVGEFKEVYPGVRINDVWDDVAMPLMKYITRHTLCMSYPKKERNRVEFKINISLGEFKHLGDPDTENLLRTQEKYNDIILYGSTYRLVSDNGTIELLSDDYYRVNIRVTMPTVFNLVQETNPNDAEKKKKVDEITKSIFERLGSDKLIDVFKKHLSTKKTSKNINVVIR